MKLSKLDYLLKNKISLEEFEQDIRNEVSEYEKKLKKKGSSIMINVIEDASMVISRESILKLKDYYISKKMDGYEILYIADCLTLSDTISYENKELEELIEKLSNLETKGKIDKNEILSILSPATRSNF